MTRVLFIFLWISILTGQGVGKLTGRITNSETGEGLAGVNVMVKGTYNAVTYTQLTQPTILHL